MANDELAALAWEAVRKSTPEELDEFLAGLERAGQAIQADTEAAWKARGGRPQ